MPKPGYEARDREAFYATLANLAALLADQRLIVLVPATAHQRAFRERARSIAPRFIEVYVDAAPETAAHATARAFMPELARARSRIYPEPT
jgi:adenylylsulfate kinase